MWKLNTDYLRIAISGLSGCGNTTVSKLLSHTLQIKFINYTLRNLAQEHNMEFEKMRLLAEQDDKWDLLLDKNQIELSRKSSCVIGSRLAIWMIPSSSLKVYLDVDETVRVQRIHKREGGDKEEVQAKTNARDLADYNRYMRLYQIDVKDYQSQADIVVDANNISAEEVTEIILATLEKKNLILNTPSS